MEEKSNKGFKIEDQLWRALEELKSGNISIARNFALEVLYKEPKNILASEIKDYTDLCKQPNGRYETPYEYNLVEHISKLVDHDNFQVISGFFNILLDLYFNSIKNRYSESTIETMNKLLVLIKTSKNTDLLEETKSLILIKLDVIKVHINKEKLEVDKVNKQKQKTKLIRIISVVVLIIIIGGYGIASLIENNKTDFDVNINNIGTEWQYYYSTNPSLGGENAIIIEGTITAYVDVNYIMIKCEVYSSTGKLLGKPSGGVYIKKGETKNFKIDSFFISTGTPYDVKNIDIVKIN